MPNSNTDYKKWMGVKSDINNGGKTRKINEGDVVWVAVGENVGVEIDGKSQKYSRPVVILRKHTESCFTGVPLTTKQHRGSWYVGFEFQKKKEVAVLIQTRLFDVKRVYTRIGKLSNRDYNAIMLGYLKLIAKNMP